MVTATQSASCIENLLSHLPRAFLTSPPPNQPERSGVLIFPEHPLHVREEGWLIRTIPTPFVAQQKSVGQFVIEGDGILLQRLRDPAEKSSAIGHIFGSRAHRELRRKL